MVKNGDIILDEYIFMVTDSLFGEETMVLNKLLTYLLGYLKRYTSEKAMLELGSTVFDRIYLELQTTESSDKRKVL